MPAPSIRVLIIGGYGSFGSRLVQLLEHDKRLAIVVAGRSLASASAFCASRQAASAQLLPVHFDRLHSDAQALAALQPTVVVDASGPFQAYGSNAYRVLELCIAQRIHYLDLADGSDFVAGVAEFNNRALSAGIFAISGVSTCPALTAAVVRRLSSELTHLHSIDIGIAPSQFSNVGSSVIRAVASYAGQRTRRWRAGRWCDGYPLTESQRWVIAAPGQAPLRRRRFSLVDVPDLQLLPREWPQTTEVWVGAAPAPALLHRVLYCCAWLVRLRLLPGIAWLAAAMHWASSQLRWGEARGGMFVAVQGLDSSSRSFERQWHLLAEGDDGPFIPSMGAAALINQVLAGTPPAAGARPGIHDLELSDYEALFAQRRIHTGVRDFYTDTAAPLFERMLGSAWTRLPEAIRQVHSVAANATFSGRCNVRRGRNPLARLLARIIGFPAAGDDQPVNVQILVDSDGERWIRTTGNRSFSSVLRAGCGRSEWLVRERFGLVTVGIALVVDGDKLHYVIRGCSLLGVPLPQTLSPRTTTTESAADGVFQFDVEISHRFTGLIVRYQGWLATGQDGAPVSRLASASQRIDPDPPS